MVVKLPHEDENCSAIRAEYRPLFEAAEAAWQIAEQFVRHWDHVRAGQHTDLYTCVVAILTKQMRLFRGIYLLSEKGLGNEALMLLRAMFETFLRLKALEGSGQRARHAYLWLVWARANNRKQAAILVPNRAEFAKPLADLDEELVPAKETFKEFLAAAYASEVGLGNPVPKIGWPEFVEHGPVLRHMARLAEDLGFRDAYDTFYRHASGPAHGYDLPFYVGVSGEDGLMVNLSPVMPYVDTVLATGIVLLRDTLAIVNSLLRLGKDEEVEGLTKIVNDLRTALRK